MGGVTDLGDDNKIGNRRRVGVSSGRGGDGLPGDPPHRSIHKEASENHIGKGGLTACICIVHRGGDNARDEPDGVLIGSRCGKQVRGKNKKEV